MQSLFIIRHCEKMIFSSAKVVVMLGIFLLFAQSNARFDNGEKTERNLPDKPPHESNQRPHHGESGM